jgi:hypothetical protein
MKWLEGLFAENVTPLLWLLALGALVLAIATVATGRAKFLLGVAALAVFAVLLVIVEWIWETDRERVDKVVESLAQAVRDEDAAAVERHLAPRCRYGGNSRADIVRLAESVFRMIEIDKLTISSKKTEVFRLRQEATSEFLAVVRGKQSGVEFNPYPTRWIFTFTQDPSGEWQVIEIQQIPAFGDSHEPISPPGRGVLPSRSRNTYATTDGYAHAHRGNGQRVTGER